MASKINVDRWLESGAHLPEPLRDFHDQKEVFKAMHDIVREDPAALVKRPDWVTGQCYVIDVFLWFMARRGWTLQRTRRVGDFRDLAADVRAKTAQREAASATLLDAAFERQRPAPTTPAHKE